MAIVEIPMMSLEDFMSHFHGIKRDHGVLWRGQRDSTWNLMPSSMRLARRSRGSAGAIETRALKSFKASDPYLPELNLDGKGDQRCWAIGQHYGLSTPLLDWTGSPYVALFFACADLILNCGDDPPEKLAVWSFDINNAPEIVHHDGKEVVLTYVAGSDASNRRLLAQQGGFTLTRPESVVLDAITKYHRFLRKYVFDVDQTWGTLIHLNRMNVNFRTLYPDVNGACLHANLASIKPSYEGLS